MGNNEREAMTLEDATNHVRKAIDGGKDRTSRNWMTVNGKLHVQVGVAELECLLANLSRAAEAVAFRWLMPMGRGFVWTRWFDAGDNTPPEHCRIEYAYTHPNEDARPLSISAITAACDAYVESAVEHGWDREQVESIMRNDDMRAAIDAAMAEDSRDGD
jgi:hypothetical protein